MTQKEINHKATLSVGIAKDYSGCNIDHCAKGFNGVKNVSIYLGKILIHFADGRPTAEFPISEWHIESVSPDYNAED